MVIFKSKQEKFKGDSKIKLVGKRLFISWQSRVHDLSIKLNRANALLFKVNYVRIINS